jgi:hypothetical protein
MTTSYQTTLDTAADLEGVSDDLDQPPFTDRILAIDPEAFPLSLWHGGQSWGRTGKVGMTLRAPEQPAAEYEQLYRSGRPNGRMLWLCADNSILED